MGERGPGRREGPHLQAHHGEVVVVLVLHPRFGDERHRQAQDEPVAAADIEAGWEGREYDTGREGRDSGTDVGEWRESRRCETAGPTRQSGRPDTVTQGRVPVLGTRGLHTDKKWC